MSVLDIGDIDLDVGDRNEILKKLPHIPATLDGKKKHNTGIYVQDIPFDPLTGYALDDFHNSKYYKIDLLNYNIVKKFISNKQIVRCINEEPDWGLLKNKTFVEKTTHIHNWYDFLSRRNVDSVDKLAMFLGLIRPGKEHLKYAQWEIVEKEIWIQTEGYSFKKSHAYAYALTIVAMMNLESQKTVRRK